MAERLIAALIGIIAATSCAAVSSFTQGSADKGGAIDEGGPPLPSHDGALAFDANSCQPGEVQTYAASPYRAATGRSQGACTAQNVADYYADCFAPGTRSQAACDLFTARYSTCAACIVTPSSASRLGPLILDGLGWVRNNVAGCFELSAQGDPEGLACAKAIQALSGCEVAACQANCPVIVADGDASPLAPYRACARQADAVGCAAYAASATCAQSDAQLAGGATSKCSASSLEAFYDYAVPLFCLASPTGASDEGGAAADAISPAFDASGPGFVEGDGAAGDAVAGDGGPRSGLFGGDGAGLLPGDASFRDVTPAPGEGGSPIGAGNADGGDLDARSSTGSAG